MGCWPLALASLARCDLIAEVAVGSSSMFFSVKDLRPPKQPSAIFWRPSTVSKFDRPSLEAALVSSCFSFLLICMIRMISNTGYAWVMPVAKTLAQTSF